MAMVLHVSVYVHMQGQRCLPLMPVWIFGMLAMRMRMEMEMKNTMRKKTMSESGMQATV